MLLSSFQYAIPFGPEVPVRCSRPKRDRIRKGDRLGDRKGPDISAVERRATLDAVILSTSMVIYVLTKPEWVPALIYFPRNKNDDDDDDDGDDDDDDGGGDDDDDDDDDAIITFWEMCNQQNLCDVPPRNL